jgi:hypothetical protein
MAFSEPTSRPDEVFGYIIPSTRSGNSMAEDTAEPGIRKDPPTDQKAGQRAKLTGLFYCHMSYGLLCKGKS